MKKHILALAVAATLVTPLAQADTANVVVYGTLSLSADNVKGLSAGGTSQGGNLVESRNRISSNNSFFGFKGSEDLGDGLSAVWQLENAIAFDRQNIDNLRVPAPGAAANDYTLGRSGVNSRRNTFAGLSDKTLGTLTFGLQDTPLKNSLVPIIVFAQTLADFRAVFSTGVSTTRAENSALYVSPNLNGVVAKAMYAAGNEGGNGAFDDPYLYAASASYTDGPLFAVLAYEYNKMVSTATNAVGSVPATPGGVISLRKTTRAGVGYTLGNVKLGLALEVNANDVAGVSVLDAKGVYVSGVYKMGLSNLKAAYSYRSDNQANNGVDNTGFLTNRNDGARQITLGLDRPLSKRSTLYALYSVVLNDVNGLQILAGGPTNIAPVNVVKGGRAHGVSLGLLHSF
jgi:predicted porin